jgi:hypothetical protein
LKSKERKQFVIQGTGPKFLTRVYNDLEGFLNDVVLVPRRTFHNPKPKNTKEMREFLKRDDRFGFHHCAGTWHKSGI